MQTNELRGLLTEYGEVFGKGRVPLARGIAGALDRLSVRLPRVVIDSLHEHWLQASELDRQIGRIEMRLKSLLKGKRAAEALLNATYCMNKIE
jgi:transposase